MTEKYIVTWESLKELYNKEDYKDLKDFMKYQTVAEDGIFTWDYERWVKRKYGIKKDNE